MEKPFNSPTPPGWKPVPLVPTEEQWGGLARDVVMWLDMSHPGGGRSGAALLEHLERVGRDIPDWLRKECDKGHITKGDRAAIIYRAMVEAAPECVTSEYSSKGGA